MSWNYKKVRMPADFIRTCKKCDRGIEAFRVEGMRRSRSGNPTPFVVGCYCEICADVIVARKNLMNLIEEKL